MRKMSIISLMLTAVFAAFIFGMRFSTMVKEEMIFPISIILIVFMAIILLPIGEKTK